MMYVTLVSCTKNYLRSLFFRRWRGLFSLSLMDCLEPLQLPVRGPRQEFTTLSVAVFFRNSLTLGLSHVPLNAKKILQRVLAYVVA